MPRHPFRSPLGQTLTQIRHRTRPSHGTRTLARSRSAQHDQRRQTHPQMIQLITYRLSQNEHIHENSQNWKQHQQVNQLSQSLLALHNPFSPFPLHLSLLFSSFPSFSFSIFFLDNFLDSPFQHSEVEFPSIVEFLSKDSFDMNYSELNFI